MDQDGGGLVVAGESEGAGRSGVFAMLSQCVGQACVGRHLGHYGGVAFVDSKKFTFR